jgi:hypothetical protein
MLHVLMGDLGRFYMARARLDSELGSRYWQAVETSPPTGTRASRTLSRRRGELGYLLDHVANGVSLIHVSEISGRCSLARGAVARLGGTRR